MASAPRLRTGTTAAPIAILDFAFLVVILEADLLLACFTKRHRARNLRLLAKRCDYCADSHGFYFRVNGGAPDLLAAAMTCDVHAGSLSPAQSALLRFAVKVTDDSAATASPPLLSKAANNCHLA